MSSMPSEPSLAAFGSVETVIADPLRFKLRLGIGEDAYASLRLKKKLSEVWDVVGVAATGASAAASPAIATTFFASTASGGLLAWLGLGTAAATPVGWVIAAAVASGGAYMGVTRFMGRFAQGRVDVIPKFLNTPLDVLGAALLDLIGGLAVRISAIDGTIADVERDHIRNHFIEEWGYDPAYVTSALAIIEQQSELIRVKEVAASLARFQAANPDCNPAAMQKSLLEFLVNVAHADGRLDEREELALDAIALTLASETGGHSLKSVAGSIVELPGKAVSLARNVKDRLPTRKADDE